MATMSNTNREMFGTLTAGENVNITDYALIFNVDSASSTEGSEELLFVTGSLRNRRTLAEGDPMDFLAGSFVYTLPPGEAEAAAAKALLDSLIAHYGNPTVLLGTGAMGATGKSNEVPTNRGYTRQVMEMTIAL